MDSKKVIKIFLVFVIIFSLLIIVVNFSGSNSIESGYEDLIENGGSAAQIGLVITENSNAGGEGNE